MDIQNILNKVASQLHGTNALIQIQVGNEYYTKRVGDINQLADNTDIVNFRELKLFTGINVYPIQCFMRCTNLISVELPKQFTGISSWCFSDCSKLNSIESSGVIDHLDDGALNGCNSLSKIFSFSNIKKIGVHALYNCYKIKDIDVSNVTDFGVMCMYFDTSIEKLIIGYDCTNIGQYSFALCSGLIYIKCLPSTPPAIGTNVFDKTNNCNIYVPDDSISAYKSATNWATYSSRIKPLSEFTE